MQACFVSIGLVFDWLWNSLKKQISQENLREGVKALANVSIDREGRPSEPKFGDIPAENSSDDDERLNQMVDQESNGSMELPNSKEPEDAERPCEEDMETMVRAISCWQELLSCSYQSCTALIASLLWVVSLF